MIAGVGGELFFNALIFTSSITLEIFSSWGVAAAETKASDAIERAGNANRAAGEANKLAGEANERAERAHERAETLEIIAARLQKENLEHQEKIAKMMKEINVRDISKAQQDCFVRGIKGKRRQITLVLPDEQEPRAYGDLYVRPMFQKAGFTVKLEDLHGTAKNAGIVVCENSGDEIKIYQALRKAKIEARRSRQLKEWPVFCNIPFGGQQGMRVFIGQRVAPHGPRHR